MNPISNTAFYCCGVRMLDSEHPRSLCNDHFAKRFMDAHGLQIFEPFKSETMPNISNTVRCHIIDEAIRSELIEHPDSLIITVGAGFDTRPYRINGGNCVEIDEPQIIEYKNEKLPITECTNKLQRISINFANETLTEKLATYRTHKNIIIVIEGVFMYLQEDQIADTLKQLQQLFPQHMLLCDLMTRPFFEKFAQSVHNKLVEAGAQFTTRPDKPAEIFKQNGYAETAYTPMFKRASALGVLWDRARIPAPIANLLLGFLMKDLNGYAVHKFKLG
jgi:methyltransferase (TIGR00027 family)